jgi:hypothetical protein
MGKKHPNDARSDTYRKKGRTFSISVQLAISGKSFTAGFGSVGRLTFLRKSKSAESGGRDQGASAERRLNWIDIASQMKRFLDHGGTASGLEEDWRK